jgi:hypothetical protein
VLDRSPRPQDLATGTPHDVVLGVVAEPAQRDSTPDRLRLWRDQRIDAAPLEGAVDLGIGIAGIRGDRRDRYAGRHHGGIDPLVDDLPLVELAGRHLDVEDNPAHVVDGGVLLVGRLQPPVASGRGHARIGIGRADLLVLAGLPARLLPLILGRRVLPVDRLHVPDREAFPAHIGPDQRCIDVDHLALGDPGRNAGLHGPLKNATEALGAPALSDPRQR